MAIEIYSETLNCELWLCSDEEMGAQVRGTILTITYTVHEIIELIKLQPNSDEIIRINHAKVFCNSRIINPN
jgi:hypothetical protein